MGTCCVQADLIPDRKACFRLTPWPVVVACVPHPLRAAAAARAAKKGRKRNLALLSFGDAAEEEEAQLAALGAKAKIR